MKTLSLFRRPLTRGAPGRGPGSPYVKAGSVYYLNKKYCSYTLGLTIQIVLTNLYKVNIASLLFQCICTRCRMITTFSALLYRYTVNTLHMIKRVLWRHLATVKWIRFNITLHRNTNTRLKNLNPWRYVFEIFEIIEQDISRKGTRILDSALRAGCFNLPSVRHPFYKSIN